MAAIGRKGEVAIGIALALVMLAAVAVGVFFLVLAGVRHGTFRKFDRPPVAAVDDAGSSDAAMQRAFPDDYRRITTAVDAQTTPEDRRRVATELMLAWRRGHYREAARAPHAELAAWQATQRDLGETLRRTSSAACGAWYRGSGTGVSDLVSPQGTATSDPETIAMVAAVRSGIDRPVDRGRPTMADARALHRALLDEGMSGSTADDFIAGRYHPQDDPQLCSVMGMVDRATARLAPDVEDRLVADQLNAMARR